MKVVTNLGLGMDFKFTRVIRWHQIQNDKKKVKNL